MNGNNPANSLHNLVKKCKRIGCTSKQEEVCLHIFQQNWDKVKKATVEEVLPFLTIGNQILRLRTLAWLEEKISNPFLQAHFIPEHSTIFIFGRRHKSQALSKQIQSNSIQVINLKREKALKNAVRKFNQKPDTKTPILLLSDERLPEGYEALAQKIALGSHWEEYRDRFKRASSIEIDDLMRTNLIRLLCSLDDSNISLAITLIEGYGNFDEFVYVILLLSLVNISLQEVIVKYAPVELVELCLKHFNYPYNDYWSLREHIPILMDTDEIDHFKLIDAFHQIFTIDSTKVRIEKKSRRFRSERPVIWPLDFYKKFVRSCFRRNDQVAYYLLEKHITGNILNLQKVHTGSLPLDLAKYILIEEIYITIEIYVVLPKALTTLPNLKKISIYCYNQGNPCTAKRVNRFRQLLPKVSLEVIDRQGNGLTIIG